MAELLQGIISQTDGLKDPLEIIGSLKQVSTGVLEVKGNTCSGWIGFADGLTIVGACLEGSSQQGKPALRQLLSQRQGKFRFVDTEGQAIPELRQFSGIELDGVISNVPDFNPGATPWLYDLSEVDSSAADSGFSGKPPLDTALSTESACRESVVPAESESGSRPSKAQVGQTANPAPAEGQLTGPGFNLMLLFYSAVVLISCAVTYYLAPLFLPQLANGQHAIKNK